MIKNVKLALTFLGVVILSSSAMAQGLPGQPAQPSQAEIKAFQDIQNMQDPAEKIAAADSFAISHPQSMLLPYILTFAAEASQQMGESPKAIIYYDKVLEADPKNYNAMINIAQETANATGKFDLNKDEKLSRATDLAKQAMELIPTAEKPNPNVSDADWEAFKQQNMARTHEALAMVDVAQQNFSDAVTEFQTAIEMFPMPNPGTMIRLGNALNEAGRPDEAIPVLDQVIAMQGLPPAFIDIAKNEKKRAEQLKQKAAAGK